MMTKETEQWIYQTEDIEIEKYFFRFMDSTVLTSSSWFLSFQVYWQETAALPSRVALLEDLEFTSLNPSATEGI